MGIKNDQTKIEELNAHLTNSSVGTNNKNWNKINN